MELTVLGSGTCELRASRSSPAYHVQAGPVSILMDLGQGALRGLAQAGLEPSGVDAILISHHHPDHISDIVPFLFALNYAPNMTGKTGIKLIAHPEVHKILERLQDIFGHWITPNVEALQKAAAQHGDMIDVSGVMIRAAKVTHIESSLAFRLEYKGRCLVYLGDSEYAPELALLARGADLLITHCAATDARPKIGHIGPTASGKLAAEAGVKALLLSHLYSEINPAEAVRAASKVFDGHIWAAEDGMRLDLESNAPGIKALGQ